MKKVIADFSDRYEVSQKPEKHYDRDDELALRALADGLGLTLPDVSGDDADAEW